MTETEALEVKEVVMKENASDETQVEASVGVSEVVALVDEAHGLEVKSVEDEPAPEEEMETENKTEEFKREPAEVQEETLADENSLEASTTDQAEKPEDESQTPQKDLQQEVISNARTSTEQEEVQQSQSNPDDSNKGSITKVDENENLNDNVETIPSNTLGDKDTTQSTDLQETLITDSTHSVLPEENHEPAQIHIPEEDDDAQIHHPSNDSFTDLQETLIAQTAGSNVLKSVVDNTIGVSEVTQGVTPIPRSQAITVTSTGPLPNGSQGLPMLVKPPKTDDLLATAKEVLQLRDEPSSVLIGPGGQLLRTQGMMDMAGLTSILAQAGAGAITQTPGHRISLEGEAAEGQSMEFSDDNATYILEPITNEVVYNDDPNIMWIQETVEVEQEAGEMGGQNMIIILNPNGTVNEELMQAHGINQDTIKAVSEAQGGGLVYVTDQATPPKSSINQLQHPIPQKELGDVKPLMTSSTIPRSIMENVLTDARVQNPGMENSRSVILDPKENFLVLDDLQRDPMIEPLEPGLAGAGARIITINGQQHLVTSPGDTGGRPLPRITSQFLPGEQRIFTTTGLTQPKQEPGLASHQLPILDLSLPKKPDPSVLEHCFNPGVLVPEASVLKALTKQESGNIVTKDHLTGKIIRTGGGGKMKRPKARDENGNGTPYVHRKTTSLGALGQALHGPQMGIPRDSRENAVQICPICKFQASTKNPYRHLQDHLARVHFKERIALELPTKKPYICPEPGCEHKHYPDWQAVMRHYIGKKHGVLDRFVKENLARIRKENGGKIPGAVITPTIEVQL